jgi:Xaa-Pro aminopeptidase
MILSNEPGYYKEGGFGIRLENLVLVRDDVPQPVGAERAMLGFETLTRAAFDDALIDTALLTEAEQQWLEEYNNTIKA